MSISAGPLAGTCPTLVGCMPDYRRSRVPGGCYFFTVNLHDRRRRLLVDHIAALRAAVRDVRVRHPFTIDAWVVLPDHIHCIWTLPEGDAAYPMRWRRIKTRFTLGVAGAGGARIWQRGYWEHTIRSDADYANHVAYIHYNPVKHGYVSRVRDWPYSTFHDAVARGIVPPDWAGDVGDLDTTGESGGSTQVDPPIAHRQVPMGGPALRGVGFGE